MAGAAVPYAPLPAIGLVISGLASRKRRTMRVRGSCQVALTVVGALLVALAALSYIGYRRELDASRVRVSSGSQVVNTPCGSIEYADVGMGLPVLVVHDAGGGFDQGLELAPRLIDRRFRVIAVSRFGVSSHSCPRGCIA